MKISSLLFTACILLPDVTLAAPNSSLSYLLNLNIEELSEMTVQSASKRAEHVTEAPGIVTIITASEITKYGGNSLFDIIRRAPNINLISIPLVPTGIGFGIRGQVPAGSPSHHLTLLDGRPVRESQLGGWDHAFYQSFPLESIDKIEIIRGPGSVLYGTNAFSGVINIVTKKARKHMTKMISLGYGSFNTRTGDLAYRENFEKHDFSIHSSLKYYDTNGWDYEMTDTLGVHRSDDAFRDAFGGYVRADYKNLTVSGFSGDTNTVTHGIFPQWPFGKHESTRHFLDVGYELPINKNWKTNFNLTYNGFKNHVFKQATTLDKNRFIDVLYEATVQGEITKQMNLVAGITYDERSGHLKVGDNSKYGETIQGAYLQMDYKPIHWLKLIGGIQTNVTESAEKAKVSPRAGAIFHFNHEYGMKILYGEAFKTPVASETKLSIPAIVGNPDLKPETIRTTDLQVYYNGKNGSAALTGYVSTLDDSIRTGVNPDAPPAATFLNNNSSVKYRGIEFEGKAVISSHFDVVGSVSYQYGSENGVYKNDVSISPRFMANIGGTYSTLNGITIGLFDQYVDDVLKYRADIGSAPQVNPSVKHTHLVTANIDIALNELLDYPDTMPKVTFTLYGDNLLNKNINIPEPAGFTNTIPGHGGRSVYAKLTMEF